MDLLELLDQCLFSFLKRPSEHELQILKELCKRTIMKNELYIKSLFSTALSLGPSQYHQYISKCLYLSLKYNKEELKTECMKIILEEGIEASTIFKSVITYPSQELVNLYLTTIGASGSLFLVGKALNKCPIDNRELLLEYMGNFNMEFIRQIIMLAVVSHAEKMYYILLFKDLDHAKLLSVARQFNNEEAQHILNNILCQV